MRFDVITLFPELFAPHLTQRHHAPRLRSGPVEVQLWPLRDHADDTYRRVDDRPLRRRAGHGDAGRAAAARAGGGARASAAMRSAPRGALHAQPAGALDQALVQEFAAGAGAVLLCGRYEGVDQRFIDRHVDARDQPGRLRAVGRRIAGLALLDAVARLQPGVLSDAVAPAGQLFRRPARRPALQPARAAGTADGARAVPTVLLSGHHAEIARWRRERSLELTARRRPDLIVRRVPPAGWTRADEALSARRSGYNPRLFDPLPDRAGPSAQRALAQHPSAPARSHWRNPWT